MIKGHIGRDCRKKLAGEPAKTGPARSLEQGQQQLDQLNGQDWVQAADQGIGSLGRSCNAFDLELDPAKFQLSEWVPEEEDDAAPAPTTATAPSAGHSGSRAREANSHRSSTLPGSFF